MKKLIATISLFLICIDSFATCLIIICTPKGLYLAADSRITYSSNDLAGAADNFSKISQVGDSFFMMCGTIGLEPINYDAGRLVADCVKKISYDTTAINTLIDTLKYSLKRVAEYAISHPGYRKEKDSFLRLDVVMIIIKDYKPLIKIESFGIKNYFKSMDVSVENNTWEVNSFGIEVFGVPFKIDEFLAKKFINGENIFDANNSDEYMSHAIIDFMSIAEEVNSSVGGPIDILKISPRGEAEWLQKKPNTPNFYF